RTMRLRRDLELRLQHLAAEARAGVGMPVTKQAVRAARRGKHRCCVAQEILLLDSEAEGRIGVKADRVVGLDLEIHGLHPCFRAGSRNRGSGCRVLTTRSDARCSGMRDVPVPVAGVPPGAAPSVRWQAAEGLSAHSGNCASDKTGNNDDSL